MVGRAAKLQAIVVYKGMDTELDLTTASRETPLAIIARQQATIAQLQQRVAALETRLNTRGSPGMPGNKPARATTAPQQAPPKTPPPRLRPPAHDPTQRVEHALAVCSHGGTPLVGGWAHRKREVIEALPWRQSKSPSTSLSRGDVPNTSAGKCPRGPCRRWWRANSAWE